MEILDKDDNTVIVEVCDAIDPNYLAIFKNKDYEGVDFKIEDAPALAYAILKESGHVKDESTLNYGNHRKTVLFQVDMGPSKEIIELAHLLYGEEGFPEHPEDKQYFYDMAERAIENGWTK